MYVGKQLELHPGTQLYLVRFRFSAPSIGREDCKVPSAGFAFAGRYDRALNPLVALFEESCCQARLA